MRTKKQKLATNRNWNKGCLAGMSSHASRMQRIDSGLTPTEIKKIKVIKEKIVELLKDWS